MPIKSEGINAMEVEEAAVEPPLTTIRQPIGALGREMTRMLVRLINGEEPTSLILPTELVVRDSA